MLNLYIFLNKPFFYNLLVVNQKKKNSKKYSTLGEIGKRNEETHHYLKHIID